MKPLNVQPSNKDRSLQWRRVATLCVAILLSSGLASATSSTPLEESDDTVLATRGDIEVTVADLQARLLLIPEDVRAGVISSPHRLRTLLQQLLETKEFAAAAVSLGLDQSDRFVAEKKIGELVLLRQLWTEQVRENAIGDADVDALAREQYLADPPMRAEEVVVRQVLIRGDANDVEARERAEAIRARVANGESIAELAKTFSTDSGRFDGGLVRGSLESFVPEFATAVAKLSVRGELAPVIRTEFGFHVVQFEERIPAQAVPFAEVADTLRDAVKESVAKRAVDRESESFMREAIRFNDAALERVAKRPSADN